MKVKGRSQSEPILVVHVEYANDARSVSEVQQASRHRLTVYPNAPGGSSCLQR